MKFFDLLFKGNAGKVSLSLEDDHGIFYLGVDTIYKRDLVEIRVSDLSLLNLEVKKNT